MSPSSSLSSAEVVRADVLLVRDAEGCYRPALAEDADDVAFAADVGGEEARQRGRVAARHVEEDEE